MFTKPRNRPFRPARAAHHARHGEHHRQVWAATRSGCAAVVFIGGFDAGR